MVHKVRYLLDSYTINIAESSACVFDNLAVLTPLTITVT